MAIKLFQNEIVLKSAEKLSFGFRMALVVAKELCSDYFDTFNFEE